MDDYFLFNDLIEYKLLSGLNYDDLNNKKKSEKYNNRINTWFKFLNLCKTNKKNLVIFINGPSNSGKSSWSIELAKRLNIKNVIQTDTIRNNIRKLRNNNKNSIIHKSSYKCWEQYTKSYSKKSQIKGFESQSRIIAPYINQLILESCNNGQFAIIEGIHLVPWIINKQKFKSTFFLEFYFHIENKNLASKRLIKRTETNYLNRSPDKYLPYLESFNDLSEYLYSNSKRNKSCTIVNNTFADKALAKIFNNIFSNINKIIKDYK